MIFMYQWRQALKITTFILLTNRFSKFLQFSQTYRIRQVLCILCSIFFFRNSNKEGTANYHGKT